MPINMASDAAVSSTTARPLLPPPSTRPPGAEREALAYLDILRGAFYLTSGRGDEIHDAISSILLRAGDRPRHDDHHHDQEHQDCDAVLSWLEPLTTALQDLMCRVKTGARDVKARRTRRWQRRMKKKVPVPTVDADGAGGGEGVASLEERGQDEGKNGHHHHRVPTGDPVLISGPAEVSRSSGRKMDSTVLPPPSSSPAELLMSPIAAAEGSDNLQQREEARDDYHSAHDDDHDGDDDESDDDGDNDDAGGDDDEEKVEMAGPCSTHHRTAGVSVEGKRRSSGVDAAGASASATLLLPPSSPPPTAMVSVTTSSTYSRSRAYVTPCSSRQEVVQCLDLVVGVLGFLVPTGRGGSGQQQGHHHHSTIGRQSVKQLGQVALVCRKWREAATWEGWWGAIAEDVAPALWKDEGRAGGGGVGVRRTVVRQGRRLIEERRVWLGREWTSGLSMAFDIFDRRDGLQMLSVRGPLGFEVFDGNDCSVLCVPIGSRLEVQGGAFSARSRDNRVASMREFFSRAHESDSASSLCVRVMVKDERTGREALLWEEGKPVRRQVYAPSDYWQPFLPSGSFWVGLVGSQMLTCPLSPLGPAPLMGRVSFYACPEANQPANVPEEDKLYRLAGGDEGRYAQHCSFVRLFFDSTEERSIAHFVRSLLD